jgi:hypothetical protein
MCDLSQADEEVLMFEKLFTYGLSIDGLVGESGFVPVKITPLIIRAT